MWLLIIWLGISILTGLFLYVILGKPPNFTEKIVFVLMSLLFPMGMVVILERFLYGKPVEFHPTCPLQADEDFVKIIKIRDENLKKQNEMMAKGAKAVFTPEGGFELIESSELPTCQNG